MTEVTIETASFAPGQGWTVYAVVVTPDATRRGPEFVDLPESATPDDLRAAVAAKYA